MSMKNSSDTIMKMNPNALCILLEVNTCGCANRSDSVLCQSVLILECHGPLSDLDRLPCKGAKEVCLGFG